VKPLVEVSDLRVVARDQEGRETVIVKNASFSVPRGEVVALIGESGSGKTTIALSLMGYARPGCRIAGGRIRIGDTDVLSLSPRDLAGWRGRRVSYISQSAAAAFNPAKSIMTQVVEGTRIHALMPRETAEAKAIELFRALALPDPENVGRRYPHQVSGGQLQRLMAAMALITDPDLVILDEPTTALDVTTQIEVLHAFKDVVRERRTTAVYVSHDLAVVAQMADRVMVLRYGELVEEAPTREMLSNPQQAYTKSLWAVRSLRKEEEPGHDQILRVDAVDAAYGVLKVLHGVSIQVPRGRTVAVVGESGSGKSTLARVITGLLPPAAGSIVFDGKPLAGRLKERGKKLLQRIQMIYQMPDTALNPRRRVRDILGRPIELHLGLTGAARHQRILELLEMTELDERFLERFPSELSGGQKQRVCIARALAAEPDLIICDEVTSALDPLVAEGILDLLGRLQRSHGYAYLFITHDLGTVRRIADRVAVMLKGRLVAEGPREQVFAPPYHPYTKLLLSSVPEMDIRWLDGVLADRAQIRAAAELAPS